MFIYKIYNNKKTIHQKQNCTNHAEFRQNYGDGAPTFKNHKTRPAPRFSRKICNFEQSQNHPQPTHKTPIDWFSRLWHNKKTYKYMTRSLKIDHQNHAQIPKHKTIAKPIEFRQNPLKQSTMLLVYIMSVCHIHPRINHVFILCIVCPNEHQQVPQPTVFDYIRLYYV